MNSPLGDGRRGRLALFGAVVMIVGSVGPWATDYGYPTNGTDGTDGKVTLACGICCLLLILMAKAHQESALARALLIAGAAGGVATYDLIHELSIVGQTTYGQIGWGLYAVVGGSAITVVGFLGACRELRSERARHATPTEGPDIGLH